MPYKPYRNEATRSSILAGVADPGNQAAWGRFFDTYAGYIFAIARREGLPEADADDIVQTVMRELVHGTSLRRYDKTRGPFHLWLARLVLWRISNLRRKEAARPPLSPLPAPDGPAAEPSALTPEFEEEWMAAVTEEALRRLRAETNPDHYAIYHASAIEQLATEDILRLHSVSSSNLYQIRRRLGARFRVLLEQAMRDLDANAPPREHFRLPPLREQWWGLAIQSGGINSRGVGEEDAQQRGPPRGDGRGDGREESD